MITERFNFMLQAREAASYSVCLKRKIGVCIRVADFETVWGFNAASEPCTVCMRESCPAVHAEVRACISLMAEKQNRIATALHIWSEIPCRQCLSFIHQTTSIRQIFCLSPESYKTEYPLIERRTEEIQIRSVYAKNLGFDVIELDREEIVEYGLPRDKHKI
jgi:deoxycytidylate deaminase